MMPGPPHELEPMWRHQVLPRLIRGKFVGRTEPYVQLRTVGVGVGVGDDVTSGDGVPVGVGVDGGGGTSPPVSQAATAAS